VVVSTICPYNGLANSPFHSLVFGINNLRSDEMPTLVQNAPAPQQLCNYCATHCKIRKVTQQNLRTSPESAFLGRVDYFWIVRDPGVVWRIHYQPETDFSILVDCAGGLCAFAEAHYP
jgi:hypothetical protein